ncbi:MAG: hypothetical protein ACK5KN_14275 [Dysgonomonas sp.]|uniref:hypothetical protein n=1 Tax=Dysgonomonas sp. TaxID=1891233 RepID=UPI003A8B5AF8
MKVIIDSIMQVPKWILIIIILFYSLLLAEYIDVLNKFVYVEDSLMGVFNLSTKLSYIFTIVSGIVTWLIYALMFHIMALLFGGKAEFKDSILPLAFPYIIPSIMLLIGLFLLTDIQIPSTPDSITILKNHPVYETSMTLINCSSVLCYLISLMIIHYLYKIKWFYSILSVVLPFLAILGITEIVRIA